MELFQFSKSSVSIAGDYYQILFENNNEDPDSPYFLIQCDFEFSGKECYFESDKITLVGHYLVNNVKLEQGALTIRYGPQDKNVVRIEYQFTKQEQKELVSAAKIMFESVVIFG